MGYFSLIPYEGVTAYQMMSETDKQNLKRAAYEAAATVASLTTFLVLNSMLDDDDNEDNYAIAYAAYQARRLQSELLQFVNPSEFLRMAQSPMATVNWLDKYATVIGQGLFKEPGYALGLVDEEDIFYQRRTGTAEKGDRKVVAQLKKIIPVLNGYQTSFLKEGSRQAVKRSYVGLTKGSKKRGLRPPFFVSCSVQDIQSNRTESPVSGGYRFLMRFIFIYGQSDSLSTLENNLSVQCESP